MLKLSDLAQRPDFRLGPLSVSPSRRRIEGPAGSAQVEPIVMKVFLLLLDAGGSVVTRDELFGNAWGGVFVGDDSLNRAIAQVRRIAGETAPGLFEIETIPRTGYRLTGEIVEHFESPARTGPDGRQGPGLSRRLVIGSAGAVGLAALGGFGLWSVRSAEDRRFTELMDVGEKVLDAADPADNAAVHFRRALALRPDNAEAQGRYAYAQVMRADYGEPSRAGAAVQGAERAARAALEREPNQPHARLALVRLQRSSLDLAATEDRLRAILATDPNNLQVMRDLWGLLQSTGRSRDSLALIERAIALKPLAAGNHYPRAQLLWILGRNGEADRVIDRAMQYWPSHRFVRFARFTIFAYTDRPRAALAMLENKGTRPQQYSPEAIALWRISLAALDQRTPTSIAAARRANLEAANRDLTLTPQAASVMSALGDVDAAFEITDAFFAVNRLPDPDTRSSAHGVPVTSAAWRFAPWLFTPPIAPMRADPRFKSICDEIGLTEYWTKRRIEPDYQLGIT